MSKALEEKRNDLITRAEEVLNKAKTEERALTEDEMKEIEGCRDEIRSIKETLKLDEEIRGEQKMVIKDDKKEGEKKLMTAEEQTRAIEEKETKDFEAYVRANALGEYNERANNMDVGTNGAVIPTTIARRIIRKVYDICPILEKSSKYNTKGALVLPYYDETDTAITVAYQEEFVEMQSNVGKFTTIKLEGFLAGALALISRSLINNTDINIVDYIVDQMAYSIKRFIEHELLIGTEDKVEGLSTLTNAVTAASANAITADEVIKLHDAIKDDFQSDAMFIMSPQTRTALRLLKDEMGRYMLQDDVSLPFGTALLGKPVYVSDNMPDMATGAPVIYYGDFRGLATKFNENINIQVLREHYAPMHAVGVIGWFEFDAKVEDAQKIAVLKMA